MRLQSTCAKASVDRSTGRGRAFLLAKFQLAERVEFVPIRRWGRDSNSRSRCRDTGFQDQLVRPLRHPTALSGFKTTALGHYATSPENLRHGGESNPCNSCFADSCVTTSQPRHVVRGWHV